MLQSFKKDVEVNSHGVIEVLSWNIPGNTEQSCKTSDRTVDDEANI